MPLLSFAVAILVGTFVVFFFTRWIGRVPFSLKNSFWCSAIGHIVPAVFALIIGFLLAYHLSAAFIIGIVIALVFQTVLFQIAARTQNETLTRWRAAVIALLVIVADFVVASPIVELMQRATSK